MPTTLDAHLHKFTANGDLDLPLTMGTRYGCSIRGDFGGGAFSMLHLNEDVAILYENGTFEANGGIWIFIMNTRTRFNLIGATNPDLTLRVVQLKH